MIAAANITVGRVSPTIAIGLGVFGAVSLGAPAHAIGASH